MEMSYEERAARAVWALILIELSEIELAVPAADAQDDVDAMAEAAARLDPLELEMAAAGDRVMARSAPDYSV
jgi:hypothetical protein